MLDPPADVALLDRFFGHINNRFIRTGFIEQFDRRAQGPAKLGFAKLALLAQPDQQHPVRKRAGNIVQQQRRAELALHVAAPDDLAQIAVGGPIDQFRRQRQLAIVEYANHDASRALLLRTAALYGKFHPVT